MSPLTGSKKMWTIIAIVIVILVAWSALRSISGFMGRTMVEKVMERAAGDDADVNVKSDGSMDITTKDGTYSMKKGAPKDWPTDVPAYANATVTYSASTNQAEDKAGMALILMTSDTTAQVQAFYEAQLKSSGWNITNTMQGGGTVIMTAEKDSRQLSLAIAESNGQTGITIGVEAAK